MVGIGEAVRIKADRDMHADLIEYAEYLIWESNQHKPYPDTGERFISVQERIDIYRTHLILTTGLPLRHVTIENNCESGEYAHLEPLPPFDPANHGNQGNQNDEQPKEG